jgi:hypothetical protein
MGKGDKVGSHRSVAVLFSAATKKNGEEKNMIFFSFFGC